MTTKWACRHVPVAMNPADLPSHGCSVRQLLGSKWWLKLPPEDWPSGESQPDEDVVMQENRKGVFLPFCAKTLRPIGITPFQTITTRLYESLLGS